MGAEPGGIPPPPRTMHEPPTEILAGSAPMNITVIVYDIEFKYLISFE